MLSYSNIHNNNNDSLKIFHFISSSKKILMIEYLVTGQSQLIGRKDEITEKLDA